MGSWKSLKIDSGTGWKEIYRDAGSGGWKALEWESAGIDVGYPLLDNGNLSTAAGYTLISKNNPANTDGTITTLKLYVYGAITALKIGSFELVSGANLKCKDTYTVGNLSVGYHEETVSLDFLTGEYIGIFTTAGGIDQFTGGYNGLWWIIGDKIVVDNYSTYTLAGADGMSIEGTG